MNIRIFFVLAIVAAFLPAAPYAQAQLDIPDAGQNAGLGQQGADSQKPSLTSPQEIAMIYHKFSGTLPDFSAWARLTDEYKQAEEYEKMAVEGKKAEALLQSFALLG